MHQRCTLRTLYRTKPHRDSALDQRGNLLLNRLEPVRQLLQRVGNRFEDIRDDGIVTVITELHQAANGDLKIPKLGDFVAQAFCQVGVGSAKIDYRHGQYLRYWLCLVLGLRLQPQTQGVSRSRIHEARQSPEG